MKDGIEYVLRFGAGTTVAGDAKDDAKEGETAGETAGRYLLVMARFNEGQLEKPKLDPVPDVPDEPAKKEAAEGKDGEKKEGDAAEKLKAADEAEAKAQAALEEKRRVERENRRKQDEYDDKVKAAQKRVRELNNRFADWYYVVSNKEYAKIHLTRDAIAQKKEAEPKEPQPPK
jgi:hypothetical protein